MMPCTMGLADGEPGVSHLRRGARVALVCDGELCVSAPKSRFAEGELTLPLPPRIMGWGARSAHF